MSTLDSVRRCREEGWLPMPVAGGSKKIEGVDWTSPSYRPSDDDFGEGCNIAVRLDNLIDVEADDPIAVAILKEFVPRTRASGRPSVGHPTHYWFPKLGDATSVKFVNSDENQMTLLEWRTGRGQYTLVPDSTVPAKPQNGWPVERLIWYSQDDLAEVDTAMLFRAVRQAAVATILAHHWPRASGGRHALAGAIAGLLADLGRGTDEQLTPTDIERIVRHAARAVGDEEADDRARFALQTAEKHARNEPVTGGPTVEELLGKRFVRRVRSWWKHVAPSANLPDGAILTDDLDLKALTPEMWTRIAEENNPPRLFLQGGLPIRVAEVPEHRKQHLPTFIFQQLTVDVLRRELAECVSFFRSAGRRRARQVPPPDVVVRNMLAEPAGRIPLDPVTRIVYAPTLAPNGTVQLTPGYQPDTGAYYVNTGLIIPTVAETPTADDLARAVEALKEPLVDFPFVDQASRAHAIALEILPFVRDLIDGPTPLHLFEKAVAGEGATLLIDTLLYPSMGHEVARMSPVHSDDEWRKQLTSTLLVGPSAIVIDNARELISPQLAKVITDTVWQARILGVSRDATLRVECAWVATGINPTLHQELLRRSVPSRLASGHERPWTRTGFKIPDLRRWLRARRGTLIWAALTIARAWYVAGKPPGPRSLGMFESWAAVIGGMLAHAGITGFLGNLEDLYEDADVEGDAVRWFLEEWLRRHGTEPVTIPEVGTWALGADSQIFDLVSGNTDRGRATSFALWVRRLRGRVIEVDVEGRQERLCVHTVREQEKKPARSTFCIGPVDRRRKLEIRPRSEHRAPF